MKNLILYVMVLPTSMALLQAGDDQSDLDRMQGTWEVVALIEKGKETPQAELDALTIVIAKDLFTTLEKGEPVVKYRIKLDPTKKPKTIDFTHLAEKEKDKTEPGIYQLEQGLLKLVLDEDKKGRPTVFEGKETASYSVMVLKRKAKN
jgi:uncharacterized protein (TIGR03067 family)